MSFSSINANIGNFDSPWVHWDPFDDEISGSPKHCDGDDDEGIDLSPNEDAEPRSASWADWEAVGEAWPLADVFEAIEEPVLSSASSSNSELVVGAPSQFVIEKMGQRFIAAASLIEFLREDLESYGQTERLITQLRAISKVVLNHREAARLDVFPNGEESFSEIAEGLIHYYHRRNRCAELGEIVTFLLRAWLGFDPFFALPESGTWEFQETLAQRIRNGDLDRSTETKLRNFIRIREEELCSLPEVQKEVVLSDEEGPVVSVRETKAQATIANKYLENPYPETSSGFGVVKAAPSYGPVSSLSLAKLGLANSAEATVINYSSESWSISYHSLEPLTFFDRLSFVIAGRGSEALCPKEADPEHSRVILVLSPDQDPKDYVRSGVDALQVARLDGSEDKCGLCTSRRLAALYFAKQVKARDCIFLDDNIAHIHVSKGLYPETCSWGDVYGMYRHAAAESQHALLSAESLGSFWQKMPDSGQLEVETGAFGAKLTYLDLHGVCQRLTGEQMVIRDLLPRNLELWGEDYYLHLVLQSLSLKTGVLSRKTLVIKRSHDGAGRCAKSCKKADVWADLPVDLELPKACQHAHQAIIDIYRAHVQSEESKFSRQQERNVLCVRPESDRQVSQDTNVIDLTARYERRAVAASSSSSKEDILNSSRFSEVRSSENDPDWEDDYAASIRQWVKLRPSEADLRSPLRTALNNAASLFEERVKRGFVSAATGVGKSRMIAGLAHSILQVNKFKKRALVIAPTVQLCGQLAKGLMKQGVEIVKVDHQNTNVTYYAANKTLNNRHVAVICAASARQFLSKKEHRDSVGLVFMDELHRIPEAIYGFLAEEEEIYQIGFSATPGSLRKHFNQAQSSCLLDFSAREACRAGYLCPWVTRRISVYRKQEGGDSLRPLKPSERDWLSCLGELLTKLEHFDATSRLSDHHGLIFVRDTKESAVLERGEISYAYDSYKKKPEAILTAFERGDRRHLSAVRCLIEGFNSHKVNFALVCNDREEKDLRQILGRTLRRTEENTSKRAVLYVLRETIPDSLILNPENPPEYSRTLKIAEYVFEINSSPGVQGRKRSRYMPKHDG